MPGERCRSSRSGIIGGSEPHNIGAGNQTPDFCKSSKHSLLGYLSIPRLLVVSDTFTNVSLHSQK